MKRNWFAFWLAVNALLLVAPPIIAFHVLDNELAQAHNSNPNYPTDGDSIGIPVFTLAIWIFFALLLLNAVALGVWKLWKLIQRRQSRII